MATISQFTEAVQAFERGAQVFVNSQEMHGYNLTNQTITTTYSIIPLTYLQTVTMVE